MLLGLHVDDYEISAAIDILEDSKRLYTLVTFFPENYGSSFHPDRDGQMFKRICNLSLLRVLSLTDVKLKELPQSICELKHLRYLDLSHTGIINFPSSFSQLYNLQTLRLKGCYLEELPKDMSKLIGLEYLIFDDDDEAKLIFVMPREVSRLTKLRKLSVFYVGIGEGYGIEELKDLNLLGGKLVINHLARVTDATQANLMGKKNIIHLHLRWDLLSHDDVRSIGTINDNEVIEGLQPHPNLKKLEISYFSGSQFPAWMMSTSKHLPNLVSVTLHKCYKYDCEHLPALGGLQSLRYLSMEGFGGIKQIGNEFYRSNEEASSNEEAPFPSLVELRLSSFLNLKEWFGDQRSSTSSFSRLEKLEISHCSELSTTPTRFPSLIKLDFVIKLRSRTDLTSLPLKLLRGANNVLQTLEVNNCNEFVGFLPDNEQQQNYQPADHLSNNFLSKIDISNCASLTVLPTDFRGLNSLTYLAITGCSSLMVLPADFTGLISLTYLAITWCSSLKSLPDGIQYLPALRTLRIGRFSEDLKSFPFPEATGSDGEQYFVSLRGLEILG